MPFQSLYINISNPARFIALILILFLIAITVTPTAPVIAGSGASAVSTGSGALTPPPHPWRNGRKRFTGPDAQKAIGVRAKTAPYRRSASKTTLKKGTALLNFSDARLKDVIMTISEITGKNFILSPDVLSRKISIRTTKPVRKRDVFGIFETILAVNGLSAVRSGNYYTIVTSKSAKERGIRLFTERDPSKIPHGDSMINVLVPIRFISAKDVLQILKPRLSPGGNIVNYQSANTLIITDMASNIKKFLTLIDKLDVDLFAKLNVSLIHVNNVDVNTLSKELLDIFSILGYGKETRQLYAIPIERFNSLILFASSKDLLGAAEKWIGRLDKGASSNEISTHIYYVKNDKASNIRDLLGKLYAGDTITEPPVDTADAGPGTAPVAAPAPNASAKPSGSAYAPSAGDKPGSEHVMDILIYEPSNAIIIRSSERDYQYVLKTIKELDKFPKQVLIDALVVEVALDESTKYGIQWSAITGNVGIQSNTGIFSSAIDGPGSLISTPVGLAAVGGLNVLATDAKNFFGFLQAFASKGKVNVLSNPHILVKNYAKASISVGSDEPIATQSTQTAVTNTASLIQSIEYRRTGIILTVSPQITDDGVVAMTIHQEISDVSTSRVVGDGNFPSFTNREAETSVVIKDGETIAIGGLIDTKKNKTHSSIPLLDKIPLLGNLFKFSSISNDRTELVILITPRVISNSRDAASATEDMKSKLNTLKELIDSEGKAVSDKESR